MAYTFQLLVPGSVKSYYTQSREKYTNSSFGKRKRQLPVFLLFQIIEATDPLQWLQNHSWLDFLGVNISRNEVANEFRMSWKDPQNLWSGTLLKKLTCPPMEKERHRDPATFKGAYGFGQVDVKLATLTHRRSPTSSTNPWMNPIHIDSKG